MEIMIALLWHGTPMHSYWHWDGRMVGTCFFEYPFTISIFIFISISISISISIPTPSPFLFPSSSSTNPFLVPIGGLALCDTNSSIKDIDHHLHKGDRIVILNWSPQGNRLISGDEVCSSQVHPNPTVASHTSHTSNTLHRAAPYLCRRPRLGMVFESYVASQIRPHSSSASF